MTKKLQMLKIRETKGTVLYGITPSDGEREVTFYMPKAWLTDGYPDSILVTIEANGKKGGK